MKGEENMSPGAAGAVKRGCICPKINNNRGKGFRIRLGGHGREERTGYIVIEGCPVHAVPAHLLGRLGEKDGADKDD